MKLNRDDVVFRNEQNNSLQKFPQDTEVEKVRDLNNSETSETDWIKVRVANDPDWVAFIKNQDTI